MDDINLLSDYSGSMGQNLASIVKGIHDTRKEFSHYIKKYEGTTAGLRDASGNIGDILYEDPSIYMKMGTDTWVRWNVSIYSFG